MNFGREGLAETKTRLSDAGIDYFGDIGDSSAIYRTTMHGVPLSFVGYNEFIGSGASLGIEKIRIESDARRVIIVYTHWGDEYMPPSERVKNLARQFIDAGAEMVIGAHPHIVQEDEVYAGKHIYYSLGNFVFDQYWNESVRRGLLLRVEFTPEGVESMEEIPIDNQTDRRTCAV